MQLCKHRSCAEALHAAHPPWVSHSVRLGLWLRTSRLEPPQGAYCKLIKPHLLPEGVEPIHWNKSKRQKEILITKSKQAGKVTLHQMGVFCSWNPGSFNSVLLNDSKKNGYTAATNPQRSMEANMALGACCQRGHHLVSLPLCRKLTQKSGQAGTTGKYIVLSSVIDTLSPKSHSTLGCLKSSWNNSFRWFSPLNSTLSPMWGCERRCTWTTTLPNTRGKL